MTKKILIILIALAIMFTVSAYKKQTHKVEQLNSTITTIEEQKQSTETELKETKTKRILIILIALAIANKISEVDND